MVLRDRQAVRRTFQRTYIVNICRCGCAGRRNAGQVQVKAWRQAEVKEVWAFWTLQAQVRISCPDSFVVLLSAQRAPPAVCLA